MTVAMARKNVVKECSVDCTPAVVAKRITEAIKADQTSTFAVDHVRFPSRSS
jgi:hypothetical protein